MSFHNNKLGADRLDTLTEQVKLLANTRPNDYITVLIDELTNQTNEQYSMQEITERKQVRITFAQLAVSLKQIEQRYLQTIGQ